MAQVVPRKVGRPVLQRSGGAGALTTAEVVAERRAALRLVKLEPGIGYWLAMQRRLWRHNRWGQLPRDADAPSWTHCC